MTAACALALLILVGCRSTVPTPTVPPPEKLPEIPHGVHRDEPVPPVPPPVTSTTVAPR